MAHQKYQGGTIFVDHASSLIFVNHQVSLNASETLRGKHLFERESLSCGVEIHGYRTDMGVYKSKEFQDDLLQREQTINYSGVGAHHQNGIAERAIHTVSESAHAMLLHAAMHWPQEVSMDLWPFAIDYAVWLYNRMPRMDNGFAPMELFCRQKLDKRILRSAHVFGCPVYVLDPVLQDGRKLPRWQPKSHRGQFLGMSKHHASTIGLIQNIRTGSISPQFHLVYDDNFTTIGTNVNHENPPENWVDLLTFSRENMVDEDEYPVLSEEWLTDAEKKSKPPTCNPAESGRDPPNARFHLPDPEEQLPSDDEEIPPPMVPVDDQSDDEDEIKEDHWQPRNICRGWIPNRCYFNEKDTINTTNLDRALFHAMLDEFGLLSEEDTFLATLGMDSKPVINSQLQQMKIIESLQTDEFGLLNDVHPFAFAAKTNNDDVPNFFQAMNGNDAEGFYQAMVKELEQLASINAYTEILIESVPEGANILDSTWAFKRKRYPDGTVRKLKARWCVHGDQQIEGIDFFDNYSPVVACNKV